MRPRRLLPLFVSSIALLSGCADRMARSDAAPIAPPDGSDRAGSAPSTRAETSGLPEWLRIRLADYDAQPGPAAPRAVYELLYRGGVAYYVQAGCCDQFDPLIDARGVIVCYPTGGFTGRGDGKCLDELPAVAHRREVWRHR